MIWTTRYAREAERQIDARDQPIRRRVPRAIDELARDPRRSPNVAAIKGSDQYRPRVGDWRVIYRTAR